MPHAETNRKPARTIFKIAIAAALLLLISVLPSTPSQASDPEYVGSLDGQLVPNTDGLDQIILRPLRDPKLSLRLRLNQEPISPPAVSTIRFATSLRY